MKSFGAALLAVTCLGWASDLQAETPASSSQSSQSSANANMFLLRSTSKSPDTVVDAVKSYADARGWQYLGAFKVKQGQVTLVKFCIPEVAKQLWPIDLALSAMLPCANLGVYQKGGKTEISLLHPRYMNILYPDPAVEKAGSLAEPLLIDMLNAVAR